MDVELDYLKLVRLGSNVTNLIDLSETERKNYMGKLLDDIGIYLTYYKKVNNDLRQLKDMISHIIDKINKLGISDIDDASKEIDEYENNKSVIQEELYSLIGELSVYNNKINEIPSTDTLKSDFSKNTRLLTKMQSVLNDGKKYSPDELKEISAHLVEINVNIQKYISNINLCNTMIRHMNDSLDTEMNRYHEIDVELAKEKDIQSEISDLESEKRKCEDDIAYINNSLKDFKPSISKKEFEDFIVFLKNIQEMLNTTYEYGKKPIRKVLDLLKNNRNVKSYILHNTSFNTESDRFNIFMSKLKGYNLSLKDFETQLPCGDYKCKYKQLAIQIYNLMESEIDSDFDANLAHDIEIVWNVINKVIEMMIENKSIIDSLPDYLKSYFSIESLFNHMSNLEKIYDSEKINYYLSMLTEFEFREKRKQDIRNISDQIQFRNKVSNIDNILSKMKESENRIQEIKETIDTYRQTITENNEVIESLKNEHERLQELYESYTKYDEVFQENIILSERLKTYTESKSKISKLEIAIEKDRFNITELEKAIQKKKTNLSYYNDFSKELKKYSKIYDEMTLVKESLSSKKGIPLYYMSLYLGNTEEITNELLDIAYDGNIYIDKFNITPTEFSIPFYNRGTLIKDVRYASQGELSFLSIALSFALCSQALKKYNIMLLDEIDGPLDSSNRIKFINILENQIDRLSSEQNFLITHNDMFSGYPVDIIDLSFENQNDRYPNAYFIPIKK